VIYAWASFVAVMTGGRAKMGGDMRFIRTLYTAALMVPTLALAQNAPSGGWPIAAGSRVRILSPVFGGRTQTATVISSSPESLAFRLNDGSAPQTLTNTTITRIDVSTGRRGHKLKGALIGLATGALVGGIIGYATWQRPTCKDPNGGFGCIAIDFGRGGDAAFAGGAAGILGSFVGFLIGARETDTWAPVIVPQAPAAIEH